ncbi:VOC family protein [Streptomyces albofaciens JCM 4342]|uniref:VOC family protein n=1 Tax=Streptomyces albofaciens TaxID=66866 RepID=UPI0012397469|nr:VOC family protein [Streptomyces albofaciens]KAA6214352.1 VOC family protein [Streptomyces albofaciens JCM 4342]
MPNTLDHVIVHCHDQKATAAFLSDLMDGPAPTDWGPFTQVQTANGVGIDFLDSAVEPGAINGSHVAFLVTDEEFDAIFDRIRKQGLRYWADPFHQREGEINHRWGGRGVYVLDPGGTVAIEFMTVRYGDPADAGEE